MKKNLVLGGLALCFVIGFTTIAVTSCNGCQDRPHQTVVQTQPVDGVTYQTAPSGAQVVVVKDRDGSDILMEMAMFNMLMNSGGINSVREYHHHHYATDNQYRGGYDNRRADYQSNQSNFKPTPPPQKRPSPTNWFSTSRESAGSTATKPAAPVNSTRSFSTQTAKPSLSSPVKSPTSSFSTTKPAAPKSSTSSFSKPSKRNK